MSEISLPNSLSLSDLTSDQTFNKVGVSDELRRAAGGTLMVIPSSNSIVKKVYYNQDCFFAVTIGSDTTAGEIVELLGKKGLYEGTFHLVLEDLSTGSNATATPTTVTVIQNDKPIMGQVSALELEVSRLRVGDATGDFLSTLPMSQPLSLFDAIKTLGVRSCLKDKQWFTEIVAVHAASYCQESPLFWRAATAFEEEDDDARRREIARELVDLYFKDGADFELNVQLRTKKAVRQAATGNFDEGAPRDLFRRAVHEVLFLIAGVLNDHMGSCSSALHNKPTKGGVVSLANCDRCKVSKAVVRARHKDTNKVELLCSVCKNKDPLLANSPVKPAIEPAAVRA